MRRAFWSMAAGALVLAGCGTVTRDATVDSTAPLVASSAPTVPTASEPSTTAAARPTPTFDTTFEPPLTRTEAALPGTPLVLSAPDGYAVDADEPFLVCRRASHCAKAWLYALWRSVPADADAETELDRAATDATAQGATVQRLDIDGHRAMQMDGTTPTVYRQFHIAAGPRVVYVTILPGDGGQSALDELSATVRGGRLTARLAPKDPGWTLPSDLGLFLVESGSGFATYGPTEHPAATDVSIRVAHGCAKPNDAVELARATDTDRRLMAENVITSNGGTVDGAMLLTVDGDQAWEARGTIPGRLTTWRMWTVTIFHGTSLIIIHALHDPRDGDEPIDVYRRLVASMSLTAGASRSLTCGS